MVHELARPTAVLHNEHGSRHFVSVRDHASNWTPQSLNDLGIMVRREWAGSSSSFQDVTTSSDGVRIFNGPNASLLKWARLRRIWLYDDFVILAINLPLQTKFTYIPTAGMSTEVRRELEAATQGNNTSHSGRRR